MKWLVCGGRDFTGHAVFLRAMTKLVQERGMPTTIIEGGSKGADRMARRWAEHNGLRVHTFVARWGKEGPAAGPIRNQSMLDEGRPDLVVAFPGGAGTLDMVAKAKAAGVPIVEVERG